MKTITEVAKITGIIPQRINDYERAGLLMKPQQRTKRNYRLYDDCDIARLWRIRFYKELGYTIPEMVKIFSDPDYDHAAAIRQQIEALEEKKRQIEMLIKQAESVRDFNLDIGTAFNYIPFMKYFTYDEGIQVLVGDPELDSIIESVGADEFLAATGMRIDDAAFEYIDEWLETMDNVFKEGYEPESAETQTLINALVETLRIPPSFLSYAPGFLTDREMTEDLDDDYGQGFTNYIQIAIGIVASKAKQIVEREFLQIGNGLLELYRCGTDPTSDETQKKVKLLMETDFYRALLKAAGPKALVKYFETITENTSGAQYTSMTRLLSEMFKSDPVARRKWLEQVSQSNGLPEANPDQQISDVVYDYNHRFLKTALLHFLDTVEKNEVHEQ